MANDLTYPIKYIDSSATIHATPTLLGRIVWTNHTAAGDDLIITDADGAEILFKAKASCASDYIEFDFNGMSRSFKVDTIDTGVLLLFPYLP